MKTKAGVALIETFCRYRSSMHVRFPRVFAYNLPRKGSFHRQRCLLHPLRDVEITHTRAPQKADHEKDSLDIEKEELFPLRRAVAFHYDRGDYKTALDLALQLKEKIVSVYGDFNTVYASSLGNIALMHKMMGDFDSALKLYLDALQIYYNLQGKETSNNAKILGNVGKLYQSMALKAKGLEKLQLLERAKEALFDSLAIREKIHGINHKETVLAKIHVASFHQSQNQIKPATDLLNECLSISRTNFGIEDPLTATVLNNLGYLFKSVGALTEAKDFYLQSLDVRSKVLGDDHPETIVTMHNLSECYLSMGNDTEGNRLKQEILSILEKSNAKIDTAKGVSMEASSSQQQSKETGIANSHQPKINDPTPIPPKVQSPDNSRHIPTTRKKRRN